MGMEESSWRNQFNVQYLFSNLVQSVAVERDWIEKGRIRSDFDDGI